ncbi:MAG: IS701 family transposase [Gemmatimonadota bacterium]
MEIQELRQLRPALERFFKRFQPCIKTRPSRRHLRTYVRGQLGPLERKSIEPMALDAHVAPRTLQEFLSEHCWDEDGVTRKLHQVIQRDHGNEEAIAVVDETTFPKCGEKTVGVQRQYCGALGKVENCVATVHIGFVSGDFHTLLDGDIYLPKSWAEDRVRCDEVGVPEDVGYRPKWEIALDLLKRSLADGVKLRWLTADEVYGSVAEFRDGVADRGLIYMVEVSSALPGWSHRPAVEAPGVYLQGKSRVHPRLAPGAPRARAVSKLWKRGGPSWQLFRVKDTQKGPVVWEVRESIFYPSRRSVPTDPVRLLVARNVLSGEVKYFLSCAPQEIPLKKLLSVAFSRWHVEKIFKEGKGEVGLDHFEVRQYKSLKRHLILTSLSLYFLAHETDRLRGEKPGVDDLPGEGGGGGAARPGDVAAREDAPAGGGGREDRVLASHRASGGGVARQGNAPSTATSWH